MTWSILLKRDNNGVAEYLCSDGVRSDWLQAAQVYQLAGVRGKPDNVILRSDGVIQGKAGRPLRTSPPVAPRSVLSGSGALTLDGAETRTVLLMHKDDIVARSSGGLAQWEILNHFLLPSGLNIVDYAEACSHGERIEAVIQRNLFAITDWLANRVLPMSRANAKRLFQALGDDQGDSITVKARKSVALSALSIIDNYWLSWDGRNKTWAQVDVKRNRLRDGLAVIALTGSTATLTKPVKRIADDLGIAAEYSLLGSYPKGIFRDTVKSPLAIYKTGDMYTVAAEVAVSQILDCTNVYGHVSYTYAKQVGLPCSRCELMTTDTRDMVHAADVVNAADIAWRTFTLQFAQMCVVDFIVANRDRHNRNWGFFREEASNWRLSGLHWLYDHNNAFDKDELAREDVMSVMAHRSRVKRSISLRKAAEIALKYSDFKFIKPVSGQVFKLFGKDESFVRNAFFRRCKDLGIPVKLV
jgi:hypothetical protein